MFETGKIWHEFVKTDKVKLNTGGLVRSLLVPWFVQKFKSLRSKHIYQVSIEFNQKVTALFYG